MRGIHVFCCAAILWIPCQPVMSDEPVLAGRFYFSGIPPEASLIRVTKDIELFGETVADESLLVDRKTRGIKNIVVRLKPLDLPRSDSATSETIVKWKMSRGRYDPRIVVVNARDTLRVHVGERGLYAPALHVGYPHQPRVIAEKKSWYDFDIGPTSDELIRATCSVYPWIKGWVAVSNGDFVAVSDETGSFSFRKLPLGRYRMSVWHEGIGLLEVGHFEKPPFEWKRQSGIIRVERSPHELGENGIRWPKPRRRKGSRGGQREATLCSE